MKEYYSSLPNDYDAGKAAKGSPRSPRKHASSSISHAVVTSVDSAKKMKNLARSYIPRKLCTPVKRMEGSNALAFEDERTAVILFPDEDTLAKPAVNSTAVVDPFSFERAESPAIDQEERNVDSPTSVVRTVHFRFDDEEVVPFESDIFSADLDKDAAEADNTSIEISEAIKSINAISISEEVKAIRASIRAERQAKDEAAELWQDSFSGFCKSENFTSCEWDPKSDDDS